MKRTLSLRVRLILIILTPLILASSVVGIFALRDANASASDRFDRSLLSTALAISRDTALSGGNALSPKTLDLLSDTSGGSVFYHVYAPNGAYVTGYATPPIASAFESVRGQSQFYFDSVYRGEPVRALRYVDAMSIEGLSGDFTFTVWQDTSLRDRYVRESNQRMFGMISFMIAALTLIVWFGVRIGLRPLRDLQDAISLRSTQDLSEIQRPVPVEVSGIVQTLNDLLSELKATFVAKDEFISNAAHQLRNPIAGVLAMSEAVRSAKTMRDVDERSGELVVAAQNASDLANNLLAFERARSPGSLSDLPLVQIDDLVMEVSNEARVRCARHGVELQTDLACETGVLHADPVLLQQAILNLVDNALCHGGPDLTTVGITTSCDHAGTRIVVHDDGEGIPIDKLDLALSRFGQVSPSSGSGLGLPIAAAAIEGLGGKLNLDRCERGLVVTVKLPIISQQ